MEDQIGYKVSIYYALWVKDGTSILGDGQPLKVIQQTKVHNLVDQEFPV